ncbi:MAG: Nif3-like dinuclear metal center hexameric protein [Candidatus Muiribacteriota bacterium]
MNFKVINLLNTLNSIAPFHLAEGWDNIGLIVGNRDKKVKKILTCLNADINVAKEAFEKKVDVVLCHHPPVFRETKKFTENDFSALYEFIRKDISVIAMHTNFDVAFADKFIPDDIKNKIKKTRVFKSTNVEKIYKIAVYVPEKALEKVRKAMFRAGAGHIGQYSDCSFNLAGYGTFLPGENTNPDIGSIGKLEKVDEFKIETVCPESKLDNVINSMKKAHPYEEVAYDIYTLEIQGEKSGYGLTGEFEEDISIKDFGLILNQKFPLLKAAGDLNRKLKKIAWCNGAGGSFVKMALNQKVDLYVTGEIGYHDALTAAENGMAVFCLGHFETEENFSILMKKALEHSIKNDIIEILVSKNDKPVFRRI